MKNIIKQISHIGGLLVVLTIVLWLSLQLYGFIANAIYQGNIAELQGKINHLNDISYGCPSQYRLTVKQINDGAYGSYVSYPDASSGTVYSCDGSYTDGMMAGKDEILKQLQTNQ